MNQTGGSNNLNTIISLRIKLYKIKNIIKNLNNILSSNDIN